jgi:SAM-dependent methyltransferase
VSTREFYDDLADLYDVIYVDWEAACRRHGAAILEVVEELTASRRAPLRVLDVSAGIGTQSLPLAAAGMEVTARDLSPGAIARLRREAAARGLEVDAGVSDMRSLDTDGPYDVVVSFDNSVPHLPDDDQVLRAFREAYRVLAPGGRLVLSVRDYAKVERGADAVHRYGERRRGERVFEVRQEWVWIDPSHYRTTMIVDERMGEGSTERVRTTSTYYAIEIPRLLELMTEAGFSARVAGDVDFYQPVLIGRKSL